MPVIYSRLSLMLPTFLTARSSFCSSSMTWGSAEISLTRRWFRHSDISLIKWFGFPSKLIRTLSQTSLFRPARSNHSCHPSLGPPATCVAKRRRVVSCHNRHITRCFQDLVGGWGFNPSERYMTSSLGMMNFPISRKWTTCSKPPTSHCTLIPGSNEQTTAVSSSWTSLTCCWTSATPCLHKSLHCFGFSWNSCYIQYFQAGLSPEFQSRI